MQPDLWQITQVSTLSIHLRFCVLVARSLSTCICCTTAPQPAVGPSLSAKQSITCQVASMHARAECRYSGWTVSSTVVRRATVSKSGASYGPTTVLHHHCGQPPAHEEDYQRLQYTPCFWAVHVSILQYASTCPVLLHVQLLSWRLSWCAVFPERRIEPACPGIACINMRSLVPPSIYTSCIDLGTQQADPRPRLLADREVAAASYVQQILTRNAANQAFRR